MKIMCPSDVICLLSGLLSRQRQNERCPYGHLHFLSSHTLITKRCPHVLLCDEGGKKRKKEKGDGEDLQG